jgi:PAS domain S-box-containing protein
MNSFRLTIKNRLIILIALVVLLALSLFITSINQIRKVKEYQFLSENSSNLSTSRKSLDSLESVFLSSVPFDMYFYKTGNSKKADEIVQYIESISEQLVKIQKSFYVASNQKVGAKVADVIDELTLYREALARCQKQFFEKGYAEYGINGHVNILIEHINELCVEANIPQVKEKIDAVVVLKDNYLNEKEPSHLNKLKIITEEAKSLTLLVNKPQKINIINNIQKLQELIDNMRQIDLTIGITLNDGLKGTMRSSKDLFELGCIELNEIMKQELETAVTYGYIWLSGIFIALLLSLLLLIHQLNKFVHRPLKKIKKYLNELILGKLPDQLVFTKKDEINEMGTFLNFFVEGLKSKAAFALEIGQGKLDSKFQPLSDDDILGNALIDMEKSLQKAEFEDQKYKDEERTRVWANEGVAKFGEILRMYSHDINKLADEIIQNLVKYTNAAMGGLYFYNDDEKSNIHLEMVATFAYDRKKYLQSQILLGEGLVGTCAIEHETIFLTDIPNDYTFIASGLGDAKPRSLLLVPLKLEDEILGVVELASFHVFKDHEIDFVEKIGQTIASTVTGAKINARTAKLLEQSQKQAEEMAEQEEEMRQNMEELRTTQEDFARREAEISGFLNAIHNAALVLVYDMTGKIIDINQKLIELMGVKREDIVGRYHKEFTSMSKENNEIDRFWNDLLAGKSRNVVEKIRLASGVDIFLDQTFSPILDKTGVLSKVLCVSADITNQKTNEKLISERTTELSAKSKEYEFLTQAIDSSMFKCEYSVDCRILNINENMCRIIGHSKSELLNKSGNLFLKEDEKEQFDKIWNEVIRNNTYTGSIKRTRPTGEAVWIMASFTPVTNAEGNIVKVFFIGIDNTERKLKYQLLEEANKEIDRLKKDKE